MTTIPTLYHYTCDHGHAALTAELNTDGLAILRPGPDGYIWATDLDVPFRDGLGLTANWITCDRTAHRWRIHHNDAADHFLPWTTVRRYWNRDDVVALEASPTALPRHWYVAIVPVAAKPS